jgi:hypothetical protein
MRPNSEYARAVHKAVIPQAPKYRLSGSNHRGDIGNGRGVRAAGCGRLRSRCATPAQNSDGEIRVV